MAADDWLEGVDARVREQARATLATVRMGGAIPYQTVVECYRRDVSALLCMADALLARVGDLRASLDRSRRDYEELRISRLRTVKVPL